MWDFLDWHECLLVDHNIQHKFNLIHIHVHGIFRIILV